ncbi:MAG: alpha-L-fucosidase, partial [Planctomycetota bacterium]
MIEKTTRPQFSTGRTSRLIYPAIMLAAICGLMITGCQQQGAATSALSSAGDKDERMQWWRQARFGMFIHWGLYAVPAGEWKGEKIPGIGEWIMERAKIPVSEYEQLAGQFNPVRFDARQWVRI